MEIEKPRVTRPGVSYFIKVIRRQLPVLLLLAVILMPLVLLLGLNQKSTYSSFAVAIYDNRDAAELISKDPNSPRFGQVMDSFKAKIHDVEFLWQVAKEVGLTDAKGDESVYRAIVRQFLPAALVPWPVPKSRELPDDLTTKSLMAPYMRAKFTANADDKTNSLTLVATSEDPFEAKRLAETAMELFIQGELRYEAEGLERQLGVDSEFLKGLENDDAAGRMLAVDRQRQPEQTQGQAKTDEDRLQDTEADLLGRIAATKAEFDQEKSHNAGLRAALEADLAKLTTKLQPSHPEVMAKQAELKALGRGDNQALAGRLVQLQQKLGEVREQQRQAGYKVTADAGRWRSSSPAPGSFRSYLSDRVSELTLAQSRLARQVLDPSLRTRLRVAVPATYDEVPISISRKTRLVALGLLLMLFLLVVVTIRERWSPLARDLWRLEGKSPVPVVMEMSKVGLKRYPSISPQLAGILRESGEAKSERKNPASDILLAYRRLELEIRRRAEGNIVMLVNASPNNQSGAFIQNFLNISTSESTGNVLMIDCDFRDPVVPIDERLRSTGDFPTFVAGKVPWKDVRLPRSPERAFDLLPAPTQATEAARIYRVDVLQKLFANLSRTYSRIYLRSHDVRQATYNAALLQAVTDCFLVVDGQVTTYSDIERSLTLLGVDKLRGLILIGT